jgi:hypothetical protein
MSADDDDRNWQDECVKLIRIVIAVKDEYWLTVVDHSSPAGWTLADLLDANHDLFLAVQNADEESAAVLLCEIRALLIEFLRLAG